MRAQAAALAFFAAVAGPVAGWAGDAGAAPPGAKLMGGMFVYLADAARLTDCFTDRSYPVAMEGDYLSLERAYTEARPGPGEPLMVTFAGSIEQRPPMEGPGPVPTALVARFVHVWPGETCERNRATASLTNTYWRIVKLDDAVIGVSEGEREPHLVLRPDEPAFSATAGCNQMVGGYKLEGDRLRFEGVASTMMACPPPLDETERALASTLDATRTWHIFAQVLELRGEGDRPLALFQAVHLR